MVRFGHETPPAGIPYLEVGEDVNVI